MYKNNIKTLYQNINKKSDFITYASSYFNKEYNTIKNHWLSKFGGWSVPEEYQDEMVKLLQNWNKKQTKS